MKTSSKDKFTAGRLMTKPVETVFKLDSLHTVAQLFTERSISAAVVLDNQRRPVGIITKTDLVRRDNQSDGARTMFKRKSVDEWTGEKSPIVLDEDDLVERWMTPVILSVPADTPAHVVAQRMVKYGTHHILVRNAAPDQIIGIVSSFDLLRAYAARGEALDRRAR